MTMKETSAEELLRRLNQAEMLWSVDEWIMENVHIWPLVKIDIATRLLLQEMNAVESLKKKTVFEKFKCTLKQIWQYLRCKVQEPSHRVSKLKMVDAVFLMNTGCRRLVRGEWIDVFSDPIIQLFHQQNLTTCSLEWANSAYVSPHRYPSVYIQSAVFFAKIYAKISSKVKSYDLQDFEALNHAFGDVVSLRDVKYRMEVILCLKKYFMRKLSKLRPKFVFDTFFYNEVSMGMILACKELNIISVDIPHGIQVGIPYEGWQHRYELLPDVFLLREKYSLMRRSGYKDVYAGDLWLHQWENDHNDFVRYYDNLIKPLKDTGKILILYSLDYTKIPEPMLQAMRQSPNSFYWLVRLHPSDVEHLDNRRHELAGINNVELANSSTWPLHALLRNVDVHVTEYSSVAVEAEHFGVPTVILHTEFSGYLQDQIDKGSAIVTESPQEIIEGIERMRTKQIDKDLSANENLVNDLLKIYKDKFV